MFVSAFFAAAACRHAALEYVESPAGDATLPLVVAVHGYGDRPESLIEIVEECHLPVRVVGPRGPEPEGDGYSWFEVAFAEDGARLGEDGIARSADRLATLIDALARTRTAGRPILTGFSQGGILSFAVAARHPEAIGLAIPLAGTLPPSLWPTGPGAPKIRALHGTADGVIPLGPTTDAVRSLKERGWDAELQTFDGVEHTITREMHGVMCRTIADAIRP
jgi:phospholipase/carboxylesterase